MKTSSPRTVLMIRLGAYTGHFPQCSAYDVGKWMVSEEKK